ncbi:MAG: DEAD/DEAH box helicase [Clostridia bacterium]
MLISAEEINKILLLSGGDVSQQGKKYFEQEKVKISKFKYQDDNNYIVKTYVEGTYQYAVMAKKLKGKLGYICDCPMATKKAEICKHIVAVMFDMYVNESKYMAFLKESTTNLKEHESELQVYSETIKEKQEKSPIISYYENMEIENGVCFEKNKVNIESKMQLGPKGEYLTASFKIGIDKMYILKDIYKFGEDLNTEAIVKYGKNLEFKHIIEAFFDSSKQMALFIQRNALEYLRLTSVVEYLNINKTMRSNLVLKYNALDEFFDIMIDKKIEIEDYDYEDVYTSITFVNEDPKFSFDVQDLKKDGLILKNISKQYYMFYGQNTVYILYMDKLHKCSKIFKENILPLLEFMKNNNTKELNIPPASATSFCEYVVPHLREFSKTNIQESILKKYKAQKLGTKIYLDIDSNGNIIAKVKFCYGNESFDPFNKTAQISINRNIISEKKAKDIFKKNKFVIDYKKHEMYLSNDDDIYSFLSEGVNTFMEKFEVLITDRLKNKQIINPKVVTMGVRIENNLLNVDFKDLDFDESELKEIFKRYALKKKYYRLKDGCYINIDSYGIETLVNLTHNLGVSKEQLISGNIKLPKYRAIYLDSLINTNSNINVDKDSSFKDVINGIKEAKDIEFELPEILKTTLRSYQKTGFNWLKTIEKYGFGGILADDMGLGKTIQVISILIDAKKRTGKTSIVICPSSLYINWQKEINKFAPEIKILVVSGDADKRCEYINNIDDFDVVITSYDLLKRDVLNYKDYNFKYIIADEAQYIKNNNTKNSKAIKMLNGDAKFALTGTPMENSLAELWSIFDFCMPGYLFSYQKFKTEFENPIVKQNSKLAIAKLQLLVKPFILRRIKKEVLKELPDKTETVLLSVMEQQQEDIYKAYLAKAKDKMQQELEINGFEKSRIKILSVITRLRQICCHPSLFIENYDGKSAKLLQCMEIIQEAIKGGHKILLFSQFTSMFDIIIKEFEKKHITYSLLTGKTKVDTRIEKVEEFNKSKYIDVFLISLKAGGTGLNLTGADIVIHYDPWWNLSAQNQATDRAHRIGQKSNVQVFKLIAQNSIEEKIQKLQDRKMDLTNSVIKEGETFINKMSEKEILDLFL